MDFSYIAAPMVKQSDLPFRTLAHNYGATLTYTQMLQPERLVNDRDYLEFHLRDLQCRPKEHKVVVQLCGNDPTLVVEGAKKIETFCDGIDLNLGCPQEAARDGHYGAYLLGEKDWPVVENIVSSLVASTSVPISAKLRLCQAASKTAVLAQRLEASGASWLTLHPRTVSARRRRAGPADLSQVRILKESLSIPVITNGNVRTYQDIKDNLAYTGADGIMVGEPLLSNPCLFAGPSPIPDAVKLGVEYIGLCREYEGTVTLGTVQTHIRHFVDYQCGRRPWFKKFRSALADCKDIDEIERLLTIKLERWRGKKPRMPEDVLGETDTEAEDGLEYTWDLALVE